MWRELTKEQLQETKRHFANLPNDHVYVAMASQITLCMLGPDWWKKNVVGDTGRPDEFLQRSDSSEESCFNYQLRLTMIGHMLWLLKESSGFADFITSLKTRELEAVFFELYSAECLFESGFTIEFVKAVGEKGQDYDLRANLAHTTFYVEAKTRRHGPVLEQRKLDSTLKQARSQLPSSGPGIVFISIPVLWTVNSQAEPLISGTIQSFLKGTQRVNHVVVIWHRWHDAKQGRTSAIRVREYMNPSPRTPSPLERVVKILEPPYNKVVSEEKALIPSFW
jgi:hypothetical protein